MIARWWAWGRQALAGRGRAAGLVLALTLLRLLTDLGLGAATATRAYLLLLTAVGLLWCGRALLASVSAERPQSEPPRRPEPERPARLAGLEETVEWAARSAHVRDTRLRPEVRYAVADRLGRAGYYLGSDPRAAELLGPTTRRLVESVEVAEPRSGRHGLDQRLMTDLAAELAGLDERIERQPPTMGATYETGDAR